MDKTTPDPPSLYTLSPSILKTFTSLRGGQQTLFKALFMALWRYLWNIRRITPVAHCYALKSALMSLQPSLSVSQWFVLSKLYLFSEAGSLAIDSRSLNIKPGSWEIKCITSLSRLKFIRRTSFDPANPRLLSHRSNQKVFISFTPSGISFYGVVLKRLNDIVRDDLMNYQPLYNKKGQPDS